MTVCCADLLLLLPYSTFICIKVSFAYTCTSIVDLISEVLFFNFKEQKKSYAKQNDSLKQKSMQLTVELFLVLSHKYQKETQCRQFWCDETLLRGDAHTVAVNVLLQTLDLFLKET